MLNVGIVGCGRIGIGRGSRAGADLFYSHAGAYHQHPQTQLTAAADIEPMRLQVCQKVWGVERLYQDYDEMLRAEQFDVLSVCAPDESHYPVVDAAIKAGVRAIFCEKPFTLNYPDALDAVRRCAEQGIVLAVNHQRRWEYGHQRVRAAVIAGELGKIQQVRGLYYGGLAHVGSQLVDLLRFFLGEVDDVDVLDVIDLESQAIDVRLRFRNGTPAVLQACRKEYFQVFEVDILGTNGRVVITEFGHRIQRWHVNESLEYPGDIELYPDPMPVETQMRAAFLNAVDDIVECLKSGREPCCSGRDAAQTVEVVGRIRTAAQAFDESHGSHRRL